MREYSTPPSMDPPTSGNLTDDVVTQRREAPDLAVFSRPDGAGGWADVTAAGSSRTCASVAKGLVAAGIERRRPGRPDLPHPLRVDAARLRDLVRGCRHRPGLRDVLRRAGGLDPARTPARAPWSRRPPSTSPGSPRCAPGSTDLNHVWSFADNAVGILTRLGGDVADDDLETRRTAVGPDDLATLIYTSGTTGQPKGCMLTHGNFMVELGVAVPELDALFETEDACTLLFMPLAHVFARIIQVGCVTSRTRLAHSGDATRLADLEAVQPTFVLAVPRVFEKVFNTASQHATADGRGGVFDRAAETAIAYSRGLDKGKPSLLVARPARGVLPPRLRPAPRRARRPLRVRRVRRRSAR